jgi:5-methyltetrahydrofolate--homocysteine methyltransferase
MTETSTASAPYLQALRHRVLVLDGAMGTSLQSLELTADDFGGQEGWIDGLVLHRPDLVAGVHRGFLEAGCDVVETCTFQSTRSRLAEWGAAERTHELNARPASCPPPTTPPWAR